MRLFILWTLWPHSHIERIRAGTYVWPQVQKNECAVRTNSYISEVNAWPYKEIRDKEIRARH